MSVTLIIKSNLSRGTPVLIADMGVVIPADHTTPGTTDIETFTDSENAERANRSADLKEWLTDDAYGAGSSTLILNDGATDVGQEIIESFLSSLASGINNNLTATIDPITTDDDTSAAPGPYSVGSRWLNTATDVWFTCLDATTGAAVWKQDSNAAQIQQQEKEAPKEHFFGNLMHYPSSAGIAADTVHYIRVWLTAGLSFDKMRIFQEAGGTPTREFTLALYDQVDPLDIDADPNARVATTALMASAGVDDGTFVDAPFTATYDVTTTGYYWLAIVANSNALKFAVSASNRADYLPKREQTGPGAAALPATASGLTNPVGAIPFLSAVET
jgi:hypothetical protein